MAKAKKKTALSLEERLEQALVPEEEQPYAVPENWCWVYTPTIFRIEYGKGLSTKDLSDSGYPVFGANGQIGFYSSYMFEQSQALMSCRGAYSGTMNISLNKSFVTSNSLIISSKRIAMEPKFICCLFNSLNKDSLVSGSAQPQVTVQAFSNYPIPLIPLTEQQRIVDRIESLFAKLDEAKEKAQATLDSFETRKAAILHKAFTGELTAKWREENGIGMESWKEVIALNCLLSKPRNGYSPSPVSYPTKVKSLTLSATTSGEFKSEHFKYIDEEIAGDSYLWLKTNDILIQRANSLEKVGSSAIYLGPNNEFIYPDLMMKLQVNDTMLPKFLAYQLKTAHVMDYLRNNATGTAGNMPKINQGVVSNIPIYRPTTYEQTEIVRILDSFFAKEQKAKELCSVLDKIDLIKKSILARAFRGELGTNDPTEESALELLKSII